MKFEEITNFNNKNRLLTLKMRRYSLARVMAS